MNNPGNAARIVKGRCSYKILSDKSTGKVPLARPRHG